MWIHEIVRFRRRRLFIRRTRNIISSVLGSIRGRISEHINVQDMEKVITAAILVGIKNYADRHPNLRNNINHVIDIAKGDAEIDILSLSREQRQSPSRKTTQQRKK